MSDRPTPTAPDPTTPPVAPSAASGALTETTAVRDAGASHPPHDSDRSRPDRVRRVHGLGLTPDLVGQHRLDLRGGVIRDAPHPAERGRGYLVLVGLHGWRVIPHAIGRTRARVFPEATTQDDLTGSQMARPSRAGRARNAIDVRPDVFIGLAISYRGRATRGVPAWRIRPR